MALEVALASGPLDQDLVRVSLSRLPRDGQALLQCPELVEANRAYEALILAEANRVREQIERTQQCQGARIIPLPTLFIPLARQSRYGTPADRAMALNPNPVNLVALGRTFLVPRQFHAGFRRRIVDELSVIGATPRFIDDRFYHVRGGNLHCATQTLRRDIR